MTLEASNVPIIVFAKDYVFQRNLTCTKVKLQGGSICAYTWFSKMSASQSVKQMSRKHIRVYCYAIVVLLIIFYFFTKYLVYDVEIVC
jgi:hypothetical protein